MDALRGFALIGVGLVHVLEQHAGAAHTEQVMEVAAATGPDQVIMGIHQMLLAGKFYVLFSLLFGLSFFIQIDRSDQRGEAISDRFVWRLAILFMFGYIHHLFYRSDILMLYAVLGLSLPLLHRLSTRTLIIVALALFLGAGRFVSFSLMGDTLIMDSPDSPENHAYFDTLKNGSLRDVFAINNTGGIKNFLAFQFGIFGRGYITLGLFIIGICLGRAGVYRDLNGHKTAIKKTLAWSGGLTVVSFALMIAAWSQIQQPQDFTTWREAIALTFYDLFNLSMAAVYACAFLLAITKAKAMMKAIAPYGRMALTNYLLQSLIGTALFYGWGFGLLGEWPYRYILLMAVFIAAGQILLSQVWMRHFHYGPCEWLWRTLTLRQRVPLRRGRTPGLSTGVAG